MGNGPALSISNSNHDWPEERRCAGRRIQEPLQRSHTAILGCVGFREIWSATFLLVVRWVTAPAPESECQVGAGKRPWGYRRRGQDERGGGGPGGGHLQPALHPAADLLV